MALTRYVFTVDVFVTKTVTTKITKRVVSWDADPARTIDYAEALDVPSDVVAIVEGEPVIVRKAVVNNCETLKIA